MYSVFKKIEEIDKKVTSDTLQESEPRKSIKKECKTKDKKRWLLYANDVYNSA